MNVSASKIWNKDNRTKNVYIQNKSLILPRCSQRQSTESMKKETYNL